MINVITSASLGASYDLNRKVDGPQKVVDNLIKGLQIANIDYSLNDVVYDYTIALSGPVGKFVPAEKRDKSILGPQIWPFVENFSTDGFKKVIAPSQWVSDLFITHTIIKQEDVVIWPVGIDTEIFSPVDDLEKKFDCLIYFKRRENSDLQFVESMLKLHNKTYKILPYGSYNQSELLNLARKSKYVFLINGSESQGIGYQELMSIGLPIFNWDTCTWLDLGPKYEVPCTSTPYWSDDCGLIVHEKSSLGENFELFLYNLDNYNPRDFVVKNLSLEKQANELLYLLTNI